MKQLLAIPIYNEEETLSEVLCQIRCYYTGDVLLVDDGSDDASVAKARSSMDDKMFLKEHNENRGYGAAMQTIFTYADEHGYDVVVTMDCDAQHEPCRIPEFFDGIKDVDVCSGSRYLAELDQDTEAPTDRKAINREMTERIKKLTKFQITDSFCGFKAYRVAALKSLSLTVDGYGFPMQFWLQASKHGLTVKEIAVARIYVSFSRTFGNGLDDSEVRRSYYHSIIDRELTDEH